VTQLEPIFSSRLQLWAEYQDSYEQVNGNILRAQYSLEHCTPLSRSLASSQLQLESLQTLQDTVESGAESWRKFQAISEQLSRECCPAQTQQLDKTCEDTHCRWVQVNQDVTEQLYTARTECQLWGQFRDIYQSTLAKVRGFEDRSRHLLIELSLDDSTQEKLQTQLVETQESLRDLRALQEDVFQVGVAADALATRMDSSSCAALQSHCRYLSGKVSNLERLLTVKKPDIQDLMEQHEDFHRYLHTLETLVNESEEVLKSEDPGPEQVGGFCLETLMGHLLRFSSNSLRLEALKHLSSQLPLSDLDYRRVQALHQRWEQARATARDQCSLCENLLMILFVSKHREGNLQYHEPRYVRTLELGRELLSAADSTTKTSLEGQLSQLQEAWESTNLQLKAKIMQLTNIEKMCDRCGQEVAELGAKLGEFGADMKKELTQSSEDLKREKNKLQVRDQ
ncbi:hypothetical protein scyTo_0022077, partial [Scyliorhinus torazame]|nr:hypothetical protein [Scyliorhinus torazame]